MLNDELWIVLVYSIHVIDHMVNHIYIYIYMLIWIELMLWYP
jgi:hypothetical protein